jgi:hypothetical protein
VTGSGGQDDQFVTRIRGFVRGITSPISAAGTPAALRAWLSASADSDAIEISNPPAVCGSKRIVFASSDTPSSDSTRHSFMSSIARRAASGCRFTRRLSWNHSTDGSIPCGSMPTMFLRKSDEARCRVACAKFRSTNVRKSTRSRCPGSGFRPQVGVATIRRLAGGGRRVRRGASV